MHGRQQVSGQRIRIYIGENDRCNGKSLYVAIVQEARKRGLAGATVTRAIMGFGAHSVVHEPHPLLPLPGSARRDRDRGH